MNVHCLEDQQDLFEMSVLSQAAQVMPISADAVIGGRLSFPLIIVGKYLTLERVRQLKELIRATHRGRWPLLLFPPYVQRELEAHLDLPVSLALVRQEPGAVQLVDATLVEMLKRDTVQVRTDDGLHSSLRAGVMARNQDGLPVILRYQPKNTQAPVVVTTLQLLTYSALSDELDRVAVLEALLTYPYAIAERERPIEETPAYQEATTVSSEDLKAVTVALAAAPNQSLGELLDMLTQHLYYPIGDERLSTTLSELSRQGVVKIGEDQVQTDLDVAVRLAHEWGLWAYVRELREMKLSEQAR